MIAGVGLSGYLALGAVALLPVSLVRREGPLIITLRLVMLARAAGMLAREMAAGAWERRGRWESCKYWAGRIK
jgi:hypothetical protein